MSQSRKSKAQIASETAERIRAGILTAGGEGDLRDMCSIIVSKLDDGVFSVSETDDLLAECDEQATMLPELRRDIASLRQAVWRDTEEAYALALELFKPNPEFPAKETEPSKHEGATGTGSSQSGPYPARPGKRKASGGAASAPEESGAEVIEIPVEAIKHHPLLARVTMAQTLTERLKRRLKGGGKNSKEWKDQIKEQDGTFAALCADIAANGVRDPLKVVDAGDGAWLVADGRHRLAAASEVGQPTVPCIVVPEADVPGIIESAVATRRHMSKGAIAYLGVLLHPEIATEGEERKAATTFKKPDNNGHALSARPLEKGQETQESLAVRLGVSLQYMAQACKLYRLLAARPAIRQNCEDQVWAGSGLGGIIAGITGRENSIEPEKPEMKNRYYLQVSNAFVDIKTAFTVWQQVPEDTRLDLIGELQASLATAPEEIIEAISESIRGRSLA